MKKCPKCGDLSVDPIQCYSCGIIFQKYQYDVATVPAQAVFEKTDPAVVVSKQTMWILLSLPLVAFVVAPLLNIIVPRLVFAVSLWVHEFGHATAAWLCGIAATPFVGWTNYGAGQSWWVSLCFVFLLGVLGYKSYENKCWFLVTSFSLLFFIFLYCRFFLDTIETELFRTYMGIGGEFIISAWLVLAYHHKFPEYMQWDTLKYVSLFFGAVVFYHAFALWLGVSMNERDIPWGSLLGGEGVGDMNTLRNYHGWGRKRMIQSYVRLGYVSLAIIILHYASQVIRRTVFEKN